MRYDAVYYAAFKCNLRRIADYPALSMYLRGLHQRPGIAATVDLVRIKNDFYSISTINPGGVVPAGPPRPDLDAPHDRSRLTGKGVWLRTS